MLRLSFSTLACPDWDVRQTILAARDFGYQGIDPRGFGGEIDITKMREFSEDLDVTRQFLRERGLETPCLNSSITLVTPAAQRWEAMLEECQRYARLAGRLGAGYLRVFGGAIPKEMTRDEAAVLARRHLRQLGKMCLPERCTPLLETHDDWATSEQVMMLLSDFDPQEAGALWDVEHPFRRGEAPAATVRGLGKHLRHVHIKDAVRVEGKSLPRLLGGGELPLGESLAALAASAYGGWLCLETEKRWHRAEAPEPERSLPQCVEWLKAHWGMAEVG